MSKHTPEPWKISHDDSTEEWSIVTNQQGSIIANVNEETGPELVGSAPVMRKMPGLDNARRIVACVNACTGIRTEALEHRAHMLKAHDDTIAELKRQRDELLAALHDAATSLETIQLRSFGADNLLNDKYSMRAYAGARASVAREAITKGSAS